MVTFRPYYIGVHMLCATLGPRFYALMVTPARATQNGLQNGPQNGSQMGTIGPQYPYAQAWLGPKGPKGPRPGPLGPKGPKGPRPKCPRPGPGGVFGAHLGTMLGPILGTGEPSNSTGLKHSRKSNGFNGTLSHESLKQCVVSTSVAAMQASLCAGAICLLLPSNIEYPSTVSRRN